MSITIIPVGDAYDDGQGVKVRDAFEIVNANFLHLKNRLDSVSSNPDLEDTPPGTTIGGVSVWDPSYTYNPGSNIYVVYGGSLYEFVSADADTGTTPGTNDMIWASASWGQLGHLQNTDTKLGWYEHTVTANANTQIDLAGILDEKNVILLTGTVADIFDITFVNASESSKFIIQVASGSISQYRILHVGATKNILNRDIELSQGDYVGYMTKPGIVSELFSSVPMYPEGSQPEFLFEDATEYVPSRIVWRIKDLTPEDDWKQLFTFNDFITPEIQEAIDHAQTNHKVTEQGGFVGGYGATAGSGAALGLNAKTIDSGNNPIDAIQLGEGENNTPRTLKVYGHTLMLANGMLNPDKIPSDSEKRGMLITSDDEVVCVITLKTYIANASFNHVKFVLPPADQATGLPFLFRHNQGAYAMNIERSGANVIHVNGSDWNGITTTTPGSWFVLESDGVKYYLTQDSGITETNNID